jgi:hypothetical protein
MKRAPLPLLPGVALLAIAFLYGCSALSSSNTPPPPVISVSLTPAAPQTIQQAQTVSIVATVKGSSDNAVTWSLSGSGFLSDQTATSVTYNAPASITAPQTATITATAAADTTKTASLMIRVALSEVPFVMQPLLPPSAAPGGAGFTLTVNGVGFSTGATVEFNGTPLATTFVSGHRLTAAVPPQDIAMPATASISVRNPAPTQLISNVVFFPVATPEVSVTFTSAPGSPIPLSNPDIVAVADFNGDGRQDLAVADFFDQGTVDILLGNGDGTFTQAASSPIPIGQPVWGLIAADFNGDGKADLAVFTESSNTAGVAILPGNGDGTFAPPARETQLLVRLGLYVSGDFNGDGKLDLAVANADNDSVYILLGNGDGTFAQPLDTPVPGDASGGIAIATGDFNEDGILDLAITTGRDNAAAILLGKGDGTFAPAPGSPFKVVGFFPGSLVAADFNGDGKLDLAVPNFLSNTVSILLGNGDGTFSEATGSPIQTGNEPVNMAVGDFNADGKVDLIVQGQSPANNIVIFLGNGDGTFTHSTPATVTQAGPIAAADFNGDGRLDLAVVDSYDGHLFVLLQP